MEKGLNLKMRLLILRRTGEEAFREDGIGWVSFIIYWIIKIEWDPLTMGYFDNL
jgi:hypothetical protein